MPQMYEDVFLLVFDQNRFNQRLCNAFPKCAQNDCVFDETCCMQGLNTQIHRRFVNLIKTKITITYEYRSH